MATKPITISITDEQREAVKAISEGDDRSVSYVIREYIERGLRNRDVSRLMVTTTHRALTLQEIVDQILACEYECQGGPLRMNAAFLDLVAKAHAERCQDD